MVGIGGGVPRAESDIRLEDVVVSQPHMDRGRVIQYDLKKTTPSGLLWMSYLNTSPTTLLNAPSKVQANRLRRGSNLSVQQAHGICIPRRDGQALGPSNRGGAPHTRGSLGWGRRSGILAGRQAGGVCTWRRDSLALGPGDNLDAGHILWEHTL
jgi:hypothetical protein